MPKVPPRLLTDPEQRAFCAALRNTGAIAFALAAADCVYRDAVYTRDRRPGFEIEWRRIDAIRRMEVNE